MELRSLIRKVLKRMRLRGVTIPGERLISKLHRGDPVETAKALEEYYAKKVRLCALVFGATVLFGGILRIKRGMEYDNPQLIIPYSVIAGLFGAGVIFFLQDSDLAKLVREKEKLWIAEYPGLLHKLLIYMGAGASAGMAFIKIAEDYERHREEGKTNEVYEEIVNVKKRLMAGDSETSAISAFVKNTGTEEYMRLGIILISNLRRGNIVLLDRLKEELRNAEKSRVSRAKRWVEESETKLLLPMVLLLAMVLLMIIVPAFAQI